MKVAIGCDHAGFELKMSLIQFLQSHQIQVIDVGCSSTQAVDYPDFAAKVSELVAQKNVDKGIMLCGSGVGACIASNKIKGVRACVCHDTYSAHQGVEHDDMNLLVLGARVIGSMLAQDIVSSFLNARYSAEERHQKRLDKVMALEKKWTL